MDTVVVAGIFSIIGFVVGALGTFLVQMKLRKEKFKEVVYRELALAYEEIAKLGFEVLYGCHNLALDHQQMKNLADTAKRFQESLSKHRLFLLGSVNKEAKKFSQLVTTVTIDLMSLPEQEIKDLLLKDSPSDKISLGYDRLVDEMRKDLCVEAVLMDIKDTFKPSLGARLRQKVQKMREQVRRKGKEKENP